MPGAQPPTKTGVGDRSVPFSKIIYIERGDFMETRPKGISGCPRAQKCGCAMLMLSSARMP